MIDEIDRQILELVQADGRRSNKELAAAVGVSPSTMVNRLRNLEASGAIRGYHADVDPVALGREVQAMVMVSLQPKSPVAVAEFEAAIWRLEQSVAVSLMTGEFDVWVHLSDRSMAALAETVLSRVASAPNVVSERTSIVFEHRRRPALRALGPA